MIDFDEYILPRRQDTLQEMLARLDESNRLSDAAKNSYAIERWRRHYKHENPLDPHQTKNIKSSRPVSKNQTIQSFKLSF